MTKNSGISVGIVGLGRMGLNHIRAVQTLGYVVKDICDKNSEALDKAMLLIENVEVRASSDFDYFFSKLDVDLLIISTTADSRFEILNRALSLNVKLILCEKPILSSAHEIEEIELSARKSTSKVAVNHQMRFMEIYSKVVELKKSRDLGKITSMSVSGANFGLGMNGTHYFEAFRFVTGTEIYSISGQIDSELLPNPRGAVFADYSGSLLGMTQDNVKMFMDFSAGAGHQAVVVYNFRNGKIIINEHQGKLYFSKRASDFMELPTNRYALEGEYAEYSIAPVDSLNPTIEVIRSLVENSNFPSLENGIHAIKCALATILSSEKNGSPTLLDDENIKLLTTLRWP